MSTSDSAAVAYTHAAEGHRQEAERLQAQLDRLGRARVVVAAILAVEVGELLVTHWLSVWLLPIPIVVLAVLSNVVGRVRGRHARAQLGVAFHESGLARVEERWQGQGEVGTQFLTEEHLYAADLDLFGNGSLFERLCEARTAVGQSTLAQWLLKPATPEVIRKRQEAVSDLRPRLGLRERLAGISGRIPAGIDTSKLEQWASEPSVLPQWGRLVVSALTILLSFALAATVFDLLPWWILSVIGAAQGIVVLVLMSRTNQVLKQIEARARDLLELTEILGSLERERFTATLLTDLQSQLNVGTILPSQQLRALVSLVDLLNARRNQFFFPISIVLMWGTQMAYRLEGWRTECGASIERWFRILGEFEALLSVAGFAFENDTDPFPEIVTGGVCCQAMALGHPLLPKTSCVRNDVHLEGTRLLIVSGSNMSGKSTMLRTVGINVVLALAGAPVRAQSMRLCPFAIGATLRIQDSLQAGKSRFYAEITRIQQIVALAAGPLPLLFLLDELLHGTNSHDRFVGAVAILQALLERGALGMVTTHDLALAGIAESIGAKAQNVHFADQLEGGKMAFDYRMQSGGVQHSNAVALMRAVGLPVD